MKAFNSHHYIGSATNYKRKYWKKRYKTVYYVRMCFFFYASYTSIEFILPKKDDFTVII